MMNDLYLNNFRFLLRYNNYGIKIKVHIQPFKLLDVDAMFKFKKINNLKTVYDKSVDFEVLKATWAYIEHETIYCPIPIRKKTGTITLNLFISIIDILHSITLWHFLKLKIIKFWYESGK